MSLACPRCGAPSDGGAACFNCGADLPSVARVVQGTVLDERYEIRARLGKGGMGAVFRAWDRVLEEEVALKVLLEQVPHEADLARRFRSEIRLARKVIHPHVCRIYEYGEDKGLRFISMELIEGTDLKRVIAESPQPAARAFSIALQIAEGLEAIHRVGIVHRDLKTSNVMIDRQGNARLLDFGVAKAIGADQSTGATGTGSVVGTPEYMSPEQARGDKVDARSDLYSLGIVVYELFTGRPPFRGDTPVSVILKHLHDPPPLTGPGVDGIPPAVIDLLARALAKDREARFQTAAEMAAALQQAALRTSPAMSLSPTARTLPATAGSAALDPTLDRVPETIAGPGVTGTAAIPTAEMTLALGEKRPARYVWAGVAAAAVVLAVLFWPRPDRERPPDTGREVVVPAAPVPVVLNALPWARVRITPKAAGGSSDVSTCTTPCYVLLAPGTYRVELENGGLTPPLAEQMTVEGSKHERVFTMPSFDPERVARTAAERASP